MAPESLIAFALATGILFEISRYATTPKSERGRQNGADGSASLHEELHEIRSDIRILQWMLLVILSGMGLLLLKAFF